MRDQRARLACTLVLAFAFTACTGSSDTSTTSSETVVTAPNVTSTTEDPQLRVALPVDPQVVKGRLDNGLTYYIRENDSPGGRAELRLLVDAGSVQEDRDQAGMAHFLEHMMFNGTQRFPRNGLIEVLEAFGPRFGPDINAHTSFDETVYELSLTTDDELLQLGLDVLREWATRATLTDVDVVEERGVILDEWRLRAQGFGARVNEQLQKLLLPGTVYEGHDPIGTDESIITTSPAELERFYEDWYQPQRLAVVAVGDFDSGDMEERIVAVFGDIAATDDPRTFEPVAYEPPREPRVARHVDEESTTAGISLLWPVSSTRLVTIGDYRDSLATSLGLEILNDRLNDDALAGDGSLSRSTTIDFAWTRAIGVRGVDVEVKAEGADGGLVELLTEMERIRRHGISQSEFDRALAGYASHSQQIFEQRDSAQDAEFAAQLTAYHLSGGHLMSPDQRYDIESAIFDGITKGDVEAAITLLVSRPPTILALGPDDDGLEIPEPERIREILDGLGSLTLRPRGEPSSETVELMSAPHPAPIVTTAVDPRFEFTTLEFENGATVYLWESDIATQAVLALVEGFGGSSLVEVPDLAEAQLMTDIVGRSGVAEFDVPALRRLLAERIAGVQPWISETRQGLEGNSSTADVETLFQLIHLTMTAPRFDAGVVELVLDEMRTLNASRADLPDLLFEEALDDGYYGDDPRYFVVPSAEEIAAFEVSVAERVFSERFGDAGDFAFAFVGDFETSEMSELAARYIGTLPGNPGPAVFVDNQPLPPRVVSVTTVEAGSGQQGQIGLFFTNELEPQLEDRLAARLLELVVSARLRERIREELSATYSIFAAVDLQRDPDPFAEAVILSTGDPAGLDEISDEVIADLESLQEEGPTEAEFNTAVAQLRAELDLLDNRTLASGLVTAHLYPDQPVSDLADRYPLLDALTREDVREVAGIVFNLEQRIEVRQVPRR